MMRTLHQLGLASVLIAVAPCTPSIASKPVEGYRSPDGRLGCVLYQHFNASGNAVKCSRKGASTALLLPSAGPPRSAGWKWPAAQLGSLFFKARYNQTLYLYGGTAKLEGDDTLLRCVLKKSTGFRCLNGDGYGIRATRSGNSRITP